MPRSPRSTKFRERFGQSEAGFFYLPENTVEVGKKRVKGEKEIWIIDKVKQRKLVEGGQFETGKKWKNG